MRSAMSSQGPITANASSISDGAAALVLMRESTAAKMGVAPIARAISSAGGIRFDELDAHFMLRQLPGVFAAGEMLDWEAPTGGYLLTASLASGVWAGQGLLHYLTARR